MNINEESFQIKYQDNVITISGRLSIMLEDYENIEKFFEQIISSKPGQIILDIRNLEYLNSAGIKIICVNLILEAADIEGLKFKILCSSQYTWQKETIPTFYGLTNNLEIVFE